MSPRCKLACLLPLAAAGAAHAAALHDAPLRRQLPVPTSTLMNFTNVADPFVFDVVDLSGDAEVIYVANITVDGQSYEVQLDTGSADLWLDTQGITLSPAAHDTNVFVTVQYGDMTVASGDVFLAPTQFGNFSIPSQAFINAPGSNATSDNDLGLLGLSTKNISMIYTTLAANTSFNGLPVLYNVFASNLNVSNYFTFLLARSNLGITDGGIFSVGDVDPHWSSVLNQTRLPVVQALEQWVVLMDGVVVDGKHYTGHGVLAAAKGAADDVKDKTLALLDSGTSLGVMPTYYWDAVYRDVPGLKALDAKAGLYQLPCDTRRNVSMIFNGTEYPLNPLDLSRVNNLGSFAGGTNETICVNTFQPGDTTAAAQGLDFILGDSFMRNVYALFHFGNWTNATAGAPPPYMQLLATTNQSAAWETFDDANAMRVQQWDQLRGQFNLTNATNASSVSATARRRSVRRVSLDFSEEYVANAASRTHEYWSIW